MADDLVKRLRDSCKDIVTGEELLPGAFAYVTREEAYEYADRIEKLEAALREIAASAWDCNGKTCEHCQPNSCQNAFIARKALEGKDEQRES